MGTAGMTGVFLQVRLSSSRLPRKALRLLAGKTVIEHAMDSLSRVDAGEGYTGAQRQARRGGYP